MEQIQPCTLVGVQPGQSPTIEAEGARLAADLPAQLAYSLEQKTGALDVQWPLRWPGSPAPAIPRGVQTLKSNTTLGGTHGDSRTSLHKKCHRCMAVKRACTEHIPVLVITTQLGLPGQASK